MTAPYGFTDFQNDQEGMGFPFLNPGTPVAPAPSAAPVTPPPGPGFVDRLSGRLFPTAGSPLSNALLDPAALSTLRHQALLGLGTALLRAGGPRPVGTSNVLSDLGGALDQSRASWPQMLGGATQQAAALYQLSLQAQQRKALAQAVSSNPMPTGDAATPEAMRAWIQNLMPALFATGNTGALQTLGPLLQSVGGGMPDIEKGTYKGQPTYMRVPKFGGAATPVLDEHGQPLSAVDPLAEEVRQQNLRNQLVTQAGQIGAHYQADVAKNDWQQTAQMAQAVTDQSAAAKAGDGAAQFTMLDNFIRFSNPHGVPRIGTVELVKEAMPYYQRAQALGQNVLNGKSGLLPPEFVDQMVKAVRTGMKAPLAQWRQRYDAAHRQAQAGKIPDEMLPFDPPPGPEQFGIPNPKGPHSVAADSLDLPY